MQIIPEDLFATKGIEYMLVIGYLLLLVSLRRVIWPRKSRAADDRVLERPKFAVPDGIYFHQGHGWAAPESGLVMRVGMDDFADKLLGRATHIALPRVGVKLNEGEPGWHVYVSDGDVVPVLSPVDGEVVAVNDDVVKSPSLVHADPYQSGWLLKVRVPSATAAKHNLLSGKLARLWMNQISEKLAAVEVANQDVVLSDGAFGEIGYARALAADRWDAVAREFLLIDDAAKPAGQEV